MSFSSCIPPFTRIVIDPVVGGFHDWVEIIPLIMGYTEIVEPGRFLFQMPFAEQSCLITTGLGLFCNMICFGIPGVTV